MENIQNLNLIGPLVSEIWIFKLNFNMQISKCSMRIKFWRASFSNRYIASPTSQLILQPFRRFTYVTAHSTTLPLLHLRHRHFTYDTWQAAHDVSLCARLKLKPTYLRQRCLNNWRNVEESFNLGITATWIGRRSGPGFDPRSGQVSWVRFFRGFSSTGRQMSGSFRSPRSPNIIWPSLSYIFIHYGCQWPEMLTLPKSSNTGCKKIPYTNFEGM